MGTTEDGEAEFHADSRMIDNATYRKQAAESDAHNKYTSAYINILETYEDQIKKSVDKKNDLKGKFFYAIRFIMYGMMLLFFISIAASFSIFWFMVYKNYQSVAVITGAVTAIISSFATMIVSIFKLPEIIARYLFNKKEDKLMNEIIKNIQRYEIEAVKLENVAELNSANNKMRFTEFDAKKEKLPLPSGDLSVKDSPNTAGKQPESLPEESDKLGTEIK